MYTIKVANIKLIVMQLRNLIYSSIKTSIEHFTFFIPQFLVALILLFVFGGTFLLFLNKKKLNNFSWLLISAGSYLSAALFFLLTDIQAKLGLSFNIAITFSFTLILLLSLFGYWRSRFLFKKILSKILKNKFKVVFFSLVVLFSTFLLSKFTFDNGLHDEYQHHASVEDMINTQYFPIRDELRYGTNLSDYYHYGWYYFVILVKAIFSLDTERALDVSKLFFFIPVLPIIYYSLSIFFKKLSFFEKTFFSITFLFQGPALFFLDYYSRNVLFGQNNIIVYEPIFFQMAGITWFGVIYSLVFSLLMIKILKTKKNLLIGSFLLFSLYSQFLLNKAFLLLLIFLYGLIFINHYWENIKKVMFKNTLRVLISVLGLIAVFSGLLALIYFAEPLLFKSIFQTGGIPLVRDIEKWGLPYMNGDILTFMSIFDKDILLSFGILPLVSFLLLVNKLFKKEKISLILLSVFSFSFILPYFINFSGGELAFNKYFMVIMSVSLLTIISFYQELTRKHQYLIFFLVSSGVILPIMYFSSLTLRGYQLYWSQLDPIIEYLDEKDDDDPVVIAIDDFEYGKYLLNNLNVELMNYKVAKELKDDYKKDEIDYYVLSTEIEGEYLAKTESNFLYEK